MRRRYILALAICAILLTGFYAWTAVLRFEGAPADRALIVKPHPSLEFEYGGGEDGAWRRAHPGQAEPWWLEPDRLVTLAFGDYEEAGTLWWLSPYWLGIPLTGLLWAATLILAASAFASRRPRAPI